MSLTGTITLGPSALVFVKLLLTGRLWLWVSDQLDAQLRYIKHFIIIILYMFRATLCSSSGRIVLIQHLGKWPTWCTITLYKTFYYYNPLHVSSNTVLIIRRSICINTASAIVSSVSDRPVCRLHTGESTIPDAVFIQIDLLMMSTVLLETCRGL